jgi:DNA topoisomerase-1
MIQRLKAQIDKDILAPYFTRNKLTAVILRIMEVCNFRSGTRKMEKLHGSHGITTVHKKHINIKNDKIEIGFIGKKQVNNHCIINNKKLYDIIKTIYKLSNKNDPYLFSITNEKGEKISITMKDLNDYLKPYEITTKDLRTWNANVIFLKNLKKNIDATYNEYKVLNEKKKDSFRKKIVQESIKTTAESLHHTPTICKSSYLYKKIMEEFLANDKIIHKLNNNSNMNYENELFKLLKEYGKIDGCK